MDYNWSPITGLYLVNRIYSNTQTQIIISSISPHNIQDFTPYLGEYLTFIPSPRETESPPPRTQTYNGGGVRGEKLFSSSLWLSLSFFTSFHVVSSGWKGGIVSPVSGLMCWRGSERVMLTQLCSLNAIVANSTSFQSLCLLSSHRSLHNSEASLKLAHDLVACDTIS